MTSTGVGPDHAVPRPGDSVTTPIRNTRAMRLHLMTGVRFPPRTPEQDKIYVITSRVRNNNPGTAREHSAPLVGPTEIVRAAKLNKMGSQLTSNEARQPRSWEVWGGADDVCLIRVQHIKPGFSLVFHTAGPCGNHAANQQPTSRTTTPIYVACRTLVCPCRRSGSTN